MGARRNFCKEDKVQLLTFIHIPTLPFLPVHVSPRLPFICFPFHPLSPSPIHPPLSTLSFLNPDRDLGSAVSSPSEVQSGTHAVKRVRQ